MDSRVELTWNIRVTDEQQGKKSVVLKEDNYGNPFVTRHKRLIMHW